ncbi:MAG: hypothetical protein AB1Z98_17200 [Nannocystaceae bacterium]
MAGALVVVSACSGDGYDPPYRDPSGRLGYAGFRWQCAGAGDLGCSAGEAFPRGVALGSTYELDGRTTSDAPDGVQVREVRLVAPLRAGSRSGQRFDALEPGVVAFMALSFDGELVDYTSIEQRPVEGMRLRSADFPAFPSSCDPGSDCADAVWDEPVTDPEFIVGQTTRVRAVVTSASGAPLMGHLAYTWTVGSSSVATLGSDDSGYEIDIDVHSAGRFEITVEAGGWQQTFPFGATSEGPRRRRPEPEGTGTGGEHDTDTDTDTEGTTGGAETEGSGTTTAGEQ